MIALGEEGGRSGDVKIKESQKTGKQFIKAPRQMSKTFIYFCD